MVSEGWLVADDDSSCFWGNEAPASVEEMKEQVEKSLASKKCRPFQPAEQEVNQLQVGAWSTQILTIGIRG